MPPWKAEPGIQAYHDENRLTEAQIARIRDWVANGREEGDGPEPIVPEDHSGWELGAPEIVYTPERPIRLAAEGPDEYRNYVFRTNFKETRYFTAMDFQPGNSQAVHHVVVYVDQSGEALKLDAADEDGQPGYLTTGGVSPGFLPDFIPYTWAPGSISRHTPAGSAFKLKPGATIICQVHYHKTGKPEEDQSRLALWFAKGKPERVAQVEIVFDLALKVPAGVKRSPWEFTWMSANDFELYAIMPHMHNLGREMEAEVRRPDGTREKLVAVKDWDFRWQLTYALRKPVAIPKGSAIVMKAIYDNSDENPNNPNHPPKDVFFGPDSTDEMMLFVLTLLPMKKS